MVAIRIAVLGCLMLASCSSGAGAPLRSPSLDYSAPPPTTADGDTVGADRRAPSDKLHEGVSTDGPAPGWDQSKTGLKYDPKRRVGGAIEPAPGNGSSK
jgi:hypothetical protein